MRNILVHGLGQNASSWDKVCEYLDFDCCCPNLPELTAGKTVNYSNLYEGFVKNCGDFSEMLNICGLSLGGILALNYAIDFPDRVSSLVLVGTQYRMPKAMLKLQNVIFRFMPKSAFNEMGFGKADFIGLSKSMMYLDFSAELERISCSTMVIVGEKDKPNRKAAVEMTDKIRDCELKVINGAGHEVNVGSPQELVDLLSGFWT
ncbi:MAG: alpha/beta hydrolase [Oscillospiraceae bacterium]|nr:alpha/beta hydrolase [Oscillospiraceae bacterium]